MKKNQIFRSILLSAVAATAFSAQVSAQSYDNYNKRELPRVLQRPLPRQVRL